MRNEKKIRSILEKINKESNQQSDDLSLLTGQSGCSLFNVLLAKHFNDERFTDQLTESIQSIIDGSIYIRSNGFCSGISGVNWLLNYMCKFEYVAYEDIEEVFSDDQKLAEEALRMLRAGNYDFLEGSIGIAYYILDKQEKDTDFLDRFFRILDELMPKENDMIFYFDTITNEVNKNKVNIGLAHGIISILKFCIKSYSLKICMDVASKISKKIITYMMIHVNVDKTNSYFGNWIDQDTYSSKTSRLGWCYGDMTIAYTLYQSGLIFNNQTVIDFSMDIFEHTFKRKSVESNSVCDAGICHGAAGIAHIYNKMWHLTNNTQFKKACDFWITKTINYSMFDDTISGYKKYSAPIKLYEPESGLLEGSSGIGLVLISYLTNDFSWDHCLMLDNI